MRRWRMVTLGDVAEVSAGNPAPQEPGDFAPDGPPFVRMQDVGREHHSKSLAVTTDTLAPDSARRYRLRLYPSGTLLIPKSGASVNLNHRALLGVDAYVVSHLATVVPDTNIIEPEFLYYWSLIYDPRHQAQTTSLPSLPTSLIKAAALPLPELDEQRRIVDLLSRAEGIVRLRREARKKAAEIIPALFLDMFGDPAMNPKNWPTRSLGELVAFVSGGTPSKAREDLWIGDLPWVSPKDMKTIALYDATDHLNQVVLAETNLKLIPVGSVLIVVRGMILIHTVPVAQARVPLTINQDMKALVPRPSIDSSYLVWALKVSHRHLLNMVSTAAHGTKKLDTARLEELVIPLPPLDVQSAFGVNLARIESVQAQQRAAQSRAEATFNALLMRVFSGAESMASPPLPGEVAVA